MLNFSKTIQDKPKLTFMRVALSHAGKPFASLALQTHFAYSLFYLY